MGFKDIIDFLISIWDSLKPIYFIYQYKNAVQFRAGKYVRSVGPGWWLKIPFIDDYHAENVEIDTLAIKSITITTLDNKTISIGCEFDFKIVDIHKATVLTNDWRTNMQDICRGIMSDYLEDCEWDEIRKKVTKNAVERRIRTRAEEMGIEINNFNFDDKAISRVIKLVNHGKEN